MKGLRADIYTRVIAHTLDEFLTIAVFLIASLVFGIDIVNMYLCFRIPLALFPQIVWIIRTGNTFGKELCGIKVEASIATQIAKTVLVGYFLHLISLDYVVLVTLLGAIFGEMCYDSFFEAPVVFISSPATTE